MSNVMSKMFKHCTLLLTVLFLCATVAFGQTESGQISGTVQDVSGAVVPNAKVTVTAVDTGVTRVVNSGPSGLFVFPALKPGAYRVMIEAQGFKKSERTVELNVSANLDASVRLAVGASDTTVEVNGEAAAVAVNTENPMVAETVTYDELQSLPTSPTRNPYALVGSAGNVSEDINSNRNAGFSMNGQRSASVAILLDGAENVDEFSAGIGQPVPLDAVQEFSVLTNNFGVEYGRASGGIVNVITKSGTNKVHGSAYEFNRVSALASNTYYHNANKVSKGEFTRNNFGFSVGGPIIKNKLFFFENLEWVKVRSANNLSAGIVDSGSYSLLAPVAQTYFSGRSLVAGTSVVSTAPCVSGSTVNCDVVSYKAPADAGGGAPQNTWDNVAKIDWSISSKTTLTVRYAGYSENDLAGFVNNSPYAGFNTGQTQFDNNFTLALTHVFNPNIVDTSKLVYNRLNGPVQPLGTSPVQPTLYVDTAVSSLPGTSIPLQFPGYSQLAPGGSIPFGGPQNLYQVYNDLSILHGNHQFKVGGQFIQIRDNRVFGAYENPVEILGTSLANGVADLQAGIIYQFQGAINPQGKYPCERDLLTGSYIQTPACTLSLPVSEPAFNRNYQYNDMAFYGQDSWKVTPRFTVNVGLRWEYYGVQHNANRALDSNFVLGPGENEFEQIRNGAVELAKNGGFFWRPNYGDFAPRVGFAWDVFGNGSTAVRGGYGIGYERNFGNVTYNAIQNPPNYGVISLISGQDVPGNLPIYTDVAGPLAGSGLTKLFPAVSQRAIDQNLKTAYAETWNLDVERTVLRNSVFSLVYTGSHGVHLYDVANINLAGDGGAYLGDVRTSNRLNQQYSAMNYRAGGGFNFYDALIAGFRATNIKNTGININASYTWSHTLDDLSSTFSDGNPGLYSVGYLDPFNPKLNYGNADYNLPHRFVANASWEVPWLKNAKGLVGEALGGWSIGGNLEVRSGQPFSMYDGTNFNGQDYPQWVAPVGFSPAYHVSSDLGSGKFNYMALPVVGGTIPGKGVGLGIPVCAGLYHAGCVYTTNGQAYPGRNRFIGPSFWNSDMQFIKNFNILERFKLEARVEAYNIFNHHNMYVNAYNLDVVGLDPAMGGSGFVTANKGGSGTSSDDSRRVQLGMRLSF